MSVAPLRLRLVGVRPETHDVKTFVFRPEDGPLAYAAGQALTLRLPFEGDGLYRTFSIATPPGRADTIEMTIKAHASGRATRWMHDRLSVGAVIEANPPRGRFTIESRQTDRLAFVSAGSGASPLMAMLRHLADTGAVRDVVWLHAARTPADVLFGAELAELQRAHPALRVAVTVSRAAPGWFGLTGRLSRRLVSVAIPDFGRREVYCCGPAGFMTEARLIHAAEGGDKTLFHVEHFGPEPTTDAEAPRPSGQGAEPAFVIRLGDKQFEAARGESILAAATRQKVVIPCGCASGMCGTCRLSLIEGQVEMRHDGGLSDEEEQQGYILACSTRPASDLTLAF
jgi:ferredoxin-NADP reductase